MESPTSDSLTGPYATLNQTLTEAVGSAARVLGSLRQGRFVSDDEKRRAARALRPEGEVPYELAQALTALQCCVGGDLASARVILESILAPSLRASFPWAVVEPVLLFDVARPAVALDWYVRLAAERTSDPEAQIHAAIYASRRGSQSLALSLGRSSPQTQSPHWVTTLSTLAATAGDRTLALDWLLDWVRNDQSALEPPGSNRPDVLRAAAQSLQADGAQELIRRIALRVPETGLAEGVARRIWVLLEVADDAALAAEVMRSTWESVIGKPLSDVEFDSVIDHATESLAGRFSRLLALVYTQRWARTSGIFEGFRAVQLWRDVNEPDREVDLFLDMTRQLPPGSGAAYDGDTREVWGHIASVSLLGVHPDLRPAAGSALASIGIPLWDEIRLPEGMQRSWTSLREDRELAKLTPLWRDGEITQARSQALAAAFDDGIGPAPSCLVVDGLIEGGDHADAQQLAQALRDRYPSDPAALRALCMTYVWLGRSREATELGRAAARAAATTSRGASVLVPVLRWVANLDRQAALDVAVDAVNDARIGTYAEDLAELVDELRREVDDDH